MAPAATATMAANKEGFSLLLKAKRLALMAYDKTVAGIAGGIAWTREVVAASPFMSKVAGAVSPVLSAAWSAAKASKKAFLFSAVAHALASERGRRGLGMLLRPITWLGRTVVGGLHKLASALEVEAPTTTMDKVRGGMANGVRKVAGVLTWPAVKTAQLKQNLTTWMAEDEDNASMVRSGVSAAKGFWIFKLSLTLGRNAKAGVPGARAAFWTVGVACVLYDLFTHSSKVKKEKEAAAVSEAKVAEAKVAEGKVPTPAEAEAQAKKARADAEAARAKARAQAEAEKAKAQAEAEKLAEELNAETPPQNRKQRRGQQRKQPDPSTIRV